MENDILIENIEASWVLPLTHGELGGSYTGRFVFRCYLTPTQQLEAGRDYRSLLGQYAGMASDTEAQLSFALSQLKHRILKAPPFWSSTLQDSGYAGNIGDLNITSMVLDAAIRSEQLFKERIQKERDQILDRTIKVAEETVRKNASEE